MSAGANNQSIVVFGAGSWGTALAVVLARNGYDVLLWARQAEHVERMRRERQNSRFLPEVSFPQSLVITDNLIEASTVGDKWLLVIPSDGFRSLLQSIIDLRKSESLGGVTIAWGTKGFEPETGKLLSQVVEETSGTKTNHAVISGPSFAIEVAQCRPTALTVASADETVADRVAQWLRNDHLRVYTNTDIAGVQLGGAIKNVMAIAAGICDGMSLGVNARAALITRGLAELMRLGTALGGRPETFMGLTGVGDLILTCTDDQSRNRRVGIAMGRGRSLEQARQSVGQAVEGVHAARALHRMSQRLNVPMPITEQVYKVLYQGLAPEDAVTSLLQREPRPE